MDNEHVKVVIPEDRMAAFVRLPSCTEISIQDVRDALAREGVTAGVSAVALQQAVTGQKGIFHQVAWGKRPEPVASDNERGPLVVFRFAGSQGAPPSSVAAGQGFRQAWKRLRERGAVSAGDILAFARNAERYGKAVTVTGDPLTCIEFGGVWRPARNARISRDGGSIVSTVSGIPYQSVDGLGVLDHVEVVGDIGMGTGDVSFPGDLSVRGDVQPGFKVSASGDVLITGSLWGSATARGKIVVGGGINAPGESVESGRGVICRFCENSLVRSAGDIQVKEAVVHSLVETEGSLIAAGEKGKIAGGMVRAGLSVRVWTAGTPMGIPTVIEVGVSPKLRRELARLERELEKVRADLAQVKRERGRKPTSTRDYDALRLIRMKRLWEDQEEMLQQQIQSLAKTLQQLPKGHFAAEHVLAGLRLVMGTDVTEFAGPFDRVIMGAMPREAD